jgi:hypothetical protein
MGGGSRYAAAASQAVPWNQTCARTSAAPPAMQPSRWPASTCSARAQRSERAPHRASMHMGAPDDTADARGCAARLEQAADEVAARDADVAGEAHAAGEDLLVGGRDVRVIERRVADHHLEQQHAERPPVDRLAVSLRGRQRIAPALS